MVPDETTIHCLEDSLDVALDDATVRREAGELLFLTGNAMHAVKAVTEAIRAGNHRNETVILPFGTAWDGSFAFSSQIYCWLKIRPIQP